MHIIDYFEVQLLMMEEEHPEYVLNEDKYQQLEDFCALVENSLQNAAQFNTEIDLDDNFNIMVSVQCDEFEFDFEEFGSSSFTFAKNLKVRRSYNSDIELVVVDFTWILPSVWDKVVLN